MGLGPQNIELYRQLKLLGALDGIGNVMELGSQDFWCPQQHLVEALFAAFGKSQPPPEVLRTTMSNQLPTRLLYEALGIEYNCIDVDGRSGTLYLDLNFDPIPEDHVARYGLVTNYGTSEHILNQTNIFRAMHSFTREGGVMIHAVPFMGYLNHGFFSYHPNFFDCLARYNSYETLGLWVGPGSDGRLTSWIPWDPSLLDFLTLRPDSAHILVAAHRKMYDQDFCVPFQEVYEDKVPEGTLSRYAMVIDGEVFDGKRVRYLTKDDVVAENHLTAMTNLKTEITGLNNVIASYVGQVDGLKHELAVAIGELERHRRASETAGGAASDASIDRVAGRELLTELLARLRRRVGRLTSGG